jgi:hypothetical protein
MEAICLTETSVTTCEALILRLATKAVTACLPPLSHPTSLKEWGTFSGVRWQQTTVHCHPAVIYTNVSLREQFLALISIMLMYHNEEE